MDNKVLIAYATKYGSTKEIAGKIGEVLKEAGIDADVVPVKSAKDLTPYRNIVIGSAFYMGMWRREAANFVKKNEKGLAERKVWVFSTGPSGKGDPKELLKGVLVPSKVKAVLERIKPQDVTAFHGYLNAGKMNAFEKWVLKNVKAAPGDYRDWQMITDWARKIAEAVKKAA